MASTGDPTRPGPSPADRVSPPATGLAAGDAAWTGLVAATVQGRTAVEAETLAKAAFLAGPKRADRLLLGAGAVLFHENGRVEAAA